MTRRQKWLIGLGAFLALQVGCAGYGELNNRRTDGVMKAKLQSLVATAEKNGGSFDSKIYRGGDQCLFYYSRKGEISEAALTGLRIDRSVWQWGGGLTHIVDWGDALPTYWIEGRSAPYTAEIRINSWQYPRTFWDWLNCVP